MPFKLQREESVSDGTKRIVREQIDAALACSKGAKAHSDDNVHDVRKRIKKIRAVLRLLRGELGDRIYRKENAFFRDIAKPLTEVRDARVLVDTCDALIERCADEASAEIFSRTRDALLKRQRAVRGRVLRKGLAFLGVKTALKEAHARVEDWTIEDDSWEALWPGLKKVYGDGRRALAATEDDPIAENLHEWRKQAKYSWHQLQVLELVWPGHLKELVKLFHRLTELLGEDHDLAVFHDTLISDPDSFGGNEAVGTLGELADHRRRSLQREALALGARLYQDKPKVFADRIGGYWDIWRGEPDGAPSP